MPSIVPLVVCTSELPTSQQGRICALSDVLIGAPSYRTREIVAGRPRRPSGEGRLDEVGAVELTYVTNRRRDGARLLVLKPVLLGPPESIETP